MPSSTCSNLPHLVIFLNFSGFRVSNDIFILLIPRSTSGFANFFNWLPLVVKVSSSKNPFFRCLEIFLKKLRIFLLTKGSPPVILNFLIPISIKTEQTLSNSSNVNKSFFGKNCIFSDIQ